jgi:hypothetical protein
MILQNGEKYFRELIQNPLKRSEMLSEIQSQSSGGHTCRFCFSDEEND